jgi:hypothetical protein
MNLGAHSRDRRFSKPVSAALNHESDFFNLSIHSAALGVSVKGVDQHHDMRCLWVCPRCRAGRLLAWPMQHAALYASRPVDGVPTIIERVITAAGWVSYVKPPIHFGFVRGSRPVRLLRHGFKTQSSNYERNIKTGRGRAHLRSV